MRIANFRDDVLWAIAYKLGLDPAQEFLTDEGESITSYINAWVRRTWDNRDWPEWTQTLEFTVDAKHMVAYQSLPVGAAVPVYISRPLKIYLVDPRLSPYPIDTPFRENDYGVHVGFEHGSTVWIKFLPRAPKFTSIKWDGGRTYRKGESTYSPEKGDCYLSKINNNQGNDPAASAHPDDPPNLRVEKVQEYGGATLGSPPVSKIGQVQFRRQPSSIMAYPPLPDPPAAGTVFYIDVFTADRVFVAGATHNCVTGTETLLQIATDMAGQLSTGLGAGWTVTKVTAPISTTENVHAINVENASDYHFSDVNYAQYPRVVLPPDPNSITPNPTVTPLATSLLRAYKAEVPPGVIIPQISQVVISEEQVLPGAIYRITFIETNGGSHVAEHQTDDFANAATILSGLADAIAAAGESDPFFQLVICSVDTATPPSLTVQIGAPTGVDVEFYALASPYWERVLFPYALVEPVVRGAYADGLREAGQTDKALAEEQGAVQEETDRANKAVAPAYDALTDQQKPAPRYRTRPVTPAGR